MPNWLLNTINICISKCQIFWMHHGNPIVYRCLWQKTSSGVTHLQERGWAGWVSIMRQVEIQCLAQGHLKWARKSVRTKDGGVKPSLHSVMDIKTAGAGVQERSMTLCFNNAWDCALTGLMHAQKYTNMDVHESIWLKTCSDSVSFFFFYIS